MIHKNIYSNRIKDNSEVDPYCYEICDEETVNSLLMFICKYNPETFFIKAVSDFCETKRKFISGYTQKYILDGQVYNDSMFKLDMKTLFIEFDIIDVLDFFDICIGVINIKIKDAKETAAGSPPFASTRAVEDIEFYSMLKHAFINRLNEVFEHNNLGYKIINDVVVTKESDYLHVEAICKPLTLLVNEEFKGPLEEFENAIDNYTHKDYENTVIEACKAFESTMKAVLDKLPVEYDHNRPTANGLIRLLEDNGIFDSFQVENLNNLTKILLGLPTIRNRKAGHGDGIDTNEVKRSYASFALNLAGSYIVFILDRYYEKKE